MNQADEILKTLEMAGNLIYPDDAARQFALDAVTQVLSRGALVQAKEKLAQASQLALMVTGYFVEVKNRDAELDHREQRMVNTAQLLLPNRRDMVDLLPVVA